MDAPGWQRVKDLFHEALRVPQEQRDAHVVAAAGDDAALLAELRDLLAAHSAEGESIESAGAARRGTPTDPGVDAPGAVIDRYRILQPIGEGGFGNVFMAEQLAPIRRTVAFKILKAGMDTRRVLARFEAEQQALARMEHPNIAKVLDAGSTVTGRPYFVMELIRGIPITSYCDQANLDTRARVALFIEVCHAIQHAHQKGIIHRDIKPSNVLVTLHDGQPVPKVIDFGIAKATDQRLTDKTLFTGLREMIGTPEYMAPEQAELSGLDVDTRADIYSLGVMLYELLTGTKPFELREVMQSGYSALLEQIRDVEPPKPSTRVSTLGADAATLARHRGTDARQLGSTLRGDLDWVVMKAIAKDRTRRYDTANGLAMDLERFLRCEPVLAGPPTWRYRFAKLARRNRASFVAAGAVLLSLVAGLALALWQYGAARAHAITATRNAEIAQRREAEAEENLERARLAEAQARDLLAAEAAARRSATAHRLSAQAIALAHEDPSTALHLAIEGARLQQDDESNIALYTALDQHRSLARLDGHDARSRLLEVSADRRLAISADDSLLVIVWDLAARRLLHRFDEHDGPIRALGFSPDATLALSASDDGTVRLWRTSDGATAGILRHAAAVPFAAFQPSGAGVITLCDDGLVREWDLRSLEIGRTLATLGRRAVAIAATPDLRTLAVLDEGMSAAIIDLGSREPMRRIALSTDAPPPYYNVEQWYLPSIALSADGALALTRDLAGHVALWNTRDGTPIREYAGAGRFCGAVALSPDARRVFLLRRDPPGRGVLGEIVDAVTGAVQCTLEDPVLLGERAEGWFSPDGHTLLTIHAGTGVLWNAGSGAIVGRLESDRHGLHAPRWVGGDEQILCASHSGPLYLFARSAYPEWRALSVPPQGRDPIHVFATSPDGTRAAVLFARAGEAAPMLLIDTANGRAIARLFERATVSCHAAFSPDARRVAASASTDEGLRVHEVASGRLVFHSAEFVIYPRFSHDGRFLAALDDERATVWDLERGEKLREIPIESKLPAFVAADARQLVIADGSSGTVSLWDLASGQRRGVAEHLAFTFGGVLTPDQRFVVSIANDASGQLRDAATLRQVASLPMPTADFATLSISKDGKLIVISAETEILVYEVPSGRRFARWRSPRKFHTCVFRPDGQALVVRDDGNTLFQIPLDPLTYAESRRSTGLSAAAMERYGLGTEHERRVRAQEQLAEIVSANGLWRTALHVLTDGDTDAALGFLAKARATRRRPPAACDWVEACAHAQRLGKDAADTEALELGLAALRRFVASGTASRAVLESAPLLAPLRGSADFAAILATLR